MEVIGLFDPPPFPSFPCVTILQGNEKNAILRRAIAARSLRSLCSQGSTPYAGAPAYTIPPLSPKGTKGTREKRAAQSVGYAVPFRPVRRRERRGTSRRIERSLSINPGERAVHGSLQ